MEKTKKDNPDLLSLLVKNSFFLIASRITDFAAVIITTPIVARYLGLTAFGDYALAMAISLLMQPVVDFGFERLVCRDIAKNKKSANEIVNSAIIARILISGCIIFLIYLIVEYVFSSREMKLAILFSTVAEIMISFAAFFLSVVKAYEKMGYELISNFIHRIIFSVAIIIVVLFDQGFLSLFYAKLFSSFVFLVLTIFFVYRKFIIFSWRFSWTTLKSLSMEAYPIAIFSLILIASFKMDVFFLKYFRDSSEVALFEASHRLILQLQFIPMSITFAIFPFLSRTSDDYSKSLNIYYKRTLKYFYILSIFPTMLMVLGSDEIINLLFGDKFLPSAIALKILAWTFIFLLIETLQNNILIILGKQKLSIISVTACFISNAILDIIMIPQYGYIGASIATFIAYFILFAFSSYFVSINIGKIKILMILLKPTISIILTSIAFYVIINNTIISLFIAALIGIPIYLTTMLKLKTFDESEIVAMKDLIFKKKKRIVSERDI